MTEGDSFRQPSEVSHETILSELEDLDPAIVAELLDAARLRQNATAAPTQPTPSPNPVVIDDAASLTPAELPAQPPASNPFAGVFANHYASNTLVEQHTALYDQYDAIHDADSAITFVSALCHLSIEEQPSFLVCTGGTAPQLRVLHGCASFKGKLSKPSQHDGRVFAFTGDSYDASCPPSIHFDQCWFRRQHAAAPTHAEFTAAQKAKPLDPIVTTRTTKTASLCQVVLLPTAFLPFLIGVDLSPTAAWPILRKAADRTRQTAKLKSLWSWLCAVAEEVNTDLRLDVFLHTNGGKAFHTQRQQIATQLLPQQTAAPVPPTPSANTSSSDTSKALLLIAKTLASSKQKAAPQPKSPESRWPHQLPMLLKLCNVTQWQDLPDIWLSLADLKRGTAARVALTVACETEALQRSVTVPIITHAIANTVYDINFTPADRLNLLDGLSPWLFPARTPEEETTLRQDTNLWDQHLSGSQHHTMAESRVALQTARLSTLNGFIPLYTMVSSYEVVVAILLGPFHHAVSKITYLRELLFDMHRDIDRICQADPYFASLIVTEVRLQFLGFYRTAIRPTGVPILPSLRPMADAINFGTWRPPALPPQLSSLLTPSYRQPRPSPAPAPPEAPPQTGTPGTPGSSQQRINNTSPITHWQVGRTALRPIIDRAASQAGGAIPQSDVGANLCLTFHLKGGCWSQCKGQHSHRRLSQTEYQRMNAWVQRFCNIAPPNHNRQEPGPTPTTTYTTPNLPRDPAWTPATQRQQPSASARPPDQSAPRIPPRTRSGPPVSEIQTEPGGDDPSALGTGSARK